MAWSMRGSKTTKETKDGTGEEMEIAAHHLELIDIIGEQVLVMIDGRPATLGTGQSLQEIGFHWAVKHLCCTI